MRDREKEGTTRRRRMGTKNLGEGRKGRVEIQREVSGGDRRIRTRRKEEKEREGKRGRRRERGGEEGENYIEVNNTSVREVKWVGG